MSSQTYQPPSYPQQPYQHDQHHHHNPYTAYDHPLQTTHDPSRYPHQQLNGLAHDNNNVNPMHNQDYDYGFHQQHQKLHRVARPGHDDRIKDHKDFSYPPRQRTNSHSSASGGGSMSMDMDSKDKSLGTRMRKLVRFPCSIYGKSLMLSIGIEALLVIIMQTVIVALYFQSLRDDPLTPDSGKASDELPPYLDNRNQSRSIPAYMIVFVFAQLFQLVLAWDAVRAQNTIEIISIVVFNMCCFAYSIFEISQIKSSLCIAAPGETSCKFDSQFFVPVGRSESLLTSIKPFLIIIVVVIGLTQCAVTWLGYQLFQEFGWKIYKKIGADPNMKIMYRAYQIYLVLIKVDLFFFVGFSIQFIYLTLTKRDADPEYWVTIVVLPITVAILYVAVYAVRHESRRWMTAFIVAMHGGVAYFIFKVVRMYVGDEDQKKKYYGVKYFLTLFATLCLITILATIFNAAVCFRNFGKGLKPHIMKDSREVNNSTSATNGRVMVID